MEKICDFCHLSLIKKIFWILKGLNADQILVKRMLIRNTAFNNDFLIQYTAGLDLNMAVKQCCGSAFFRWGSDLHPDLFSTKNIF